MLILLNLLRNISLALKPALAGFLTLLLCCSCIKPPTARYANVLPSQELELISTVKRGKDYSNRGRMDLAEFEFRKALKLSPASDSINNDLGFVLQAQGRADEAKVFYRRAIKLSSENIEARENLARALFQQGDMRGALIETIKLVDALNSLPEEKLAQMTAQSPNGQPPLIGVFRKLSAIYYKVGVIDDAVCYSWLAHILAANMQEAGQHARLLLSLSKTGPALQTLRDVVLANQGNVPSKIYLDYGVALYLVGDESLSKMALAKVLTGADSERVDRRSARLLNVLIARRNKRLKEAELYEEGLFEEEPEFCSVEELDSDGYWPYELGVQMEGLAKAICENKQEENEQQLVGTA